MRDLFYMALLVLLLVLMFGYRERILAVLARFDRRNVERQMEQAQERSDPTAHFRHTLKLAEEQVEAISEITVSDERTATPVTRYLFEGETFATRLEAEKARAEAIGRIARGFYAELPRALAGRGNGKLGRE
ncbi:MAG TPA: hypothetical protein VG891_04070 [Rhizomicrobium sp.]|nr:hypothetical protein [Rhizomicrobium sp.]